MVSWRWVSRRCRLSGAGEGLLGGALAGEFSRRCAGCGASGIASHGQDYVAEAMDLFYRVVMHERHPDRPGVRV